MNPSPRLSDNAALRPFIIGLIGHRNLSPDEAPSLQKSLDNFLEEILKQLPNTPVLVLTSLAKGADRLIESSKFRRRVKVCAVLPLEVDEYLKDFETKGEKDEFRRVLANCEMNLTMDSTSSKRRISKKARNIAYKECAEWISDRCNALYVVWDGRPSRGVGGTSDTVKYRFNSTKANANFDGGGLYLLHSLASNAGQNPVEQCLCGGHNGITDKDLRDLIDFDRLNFYLTDVPSSNLARNLDYHFNIFDQEAIALQKSFIKRTRLLLVLGILTVNLASLHLDVSHPLTFVLSIFSLALTGYFWNRLTKSQVKTAYETFRLMAEVIRVQKWWNSCGVSASVLNEITELRETSGPARVFLSNTFFMNEIAQQTKGELFVDPSRPETFIEDQYNYLVSGSSNGAIKRNERKAGRIKIVIATFVLAALISFVLGTSLPLLPDSNSEFDLARFASYIFTATLSMAAATAAFSQVMGYGELASRYRVKEVRLKAALEIVRKAESSKEVLVVAKQVGIDSLSEAFRWFQMKSDRQVRPFQ